MTQVEKDLLRPIFWDIDINNLDFEKHKRYTIERVLQFGRSEHLRWLLENSTDEEIIETVKRSRNIDRKTANLWSIHFNIAREEIECFRKPLIPNNPFY